MFLKITQEVLRIEKQMKIYFKKTKTQKQNQIPEFLLFAIILRTQEDRTHKERKEDEIYSWWAARK